MTALQNFENEMVEHIKEFTPQHSSEIGDIAVRKVVQVGIDRAREYDLTNRGPVRFFIEMMFILGCSFDTDPQYPWVKKILKDSAETSDQMKRADSLHIKLIDYMEKVIGPENKHEQMAYERQKASTVALKKLELLGDKDEIVPFINEMVNHLKLIYPEKYQYVGESKIRELLQKAISQKELYFPEGEVLL